MRQSGKVQIGQALRYKGWNKIGLSGNSLFLPYVHLGATRDDDDNKLG
jgi:hypothetical protein